MSTVQVVFPLPVDREFIYRLPPDLAGSVSPGSGVLVPFRGKKRLGFVVGFNQSQNGETGESDGFAQGDNSKFRIEEVDSILEPLPLFSEKILKLTRWIADYYLCSWGEALKATLPPGVDLKKKKVVHWKGSSPEENPESEDNSTRSRIMNLVKESREIPLDRLKRKITKEHVSRDEFHGILSGLEESGLLEVRIEKKGLKFQPKRYQKVKFVGSREEALKEVKRIEKRAPRQAYTLQKLLETPDGMFKKEIPPSMKRFENNGWVESFWVEEIRDPLTQFGVRSEIGVQITRPPSLTSEQEKSVETVKGFLDRNEYGTVLLYGVTGSGKTEIYLRSIGEALKQKKKAILLVPEISLTPQTVSRFLHRFQGDGKQEAGFQSGRIALLHSSLSPGERFDIWRKIRRGDVDIVIGARSAIFAPVENLGIICVDEEHETSYKQSEHQPRYHGRDVAIMRAFMEGAVCVLGSATPSFESYYKAQKGKYHFLSLPQRIDRRSMPPVEVVDMRDERRIVKGKSKTLNSKIHKSQITIHRSSSSLLSSLLEEKIRDRLLKKEQILLFINRRGYAPFLLCQDCGYVPECTRCSVTLTFHRRIRSKEFQNSDSPIHTSPFLLCHYCGLKRRVFRECPKCRGTRILTKGFGTERVEEELREMFPTIRVVRMDMDTTRKKGSHAALFKAFESGQGDLLLGTQMVVKGFDLPRITLVGVLSADTSIHFPDLRSSERTFQLLEQVAGRTGRSSLGGEVVIQTYSPQHPAVQFASRHDYDRFFQVEIKDRSTFRYPPYSRAAKILVTSHHEKDAEEEARRIARRLRNGIEKGGSAIDIDVFGPVPALIPRLRGAHRWQILLLSPEGRVIQNYLRSVQVTNSHSMRKDITRIQVDIDPIDVV
jgi:primosomal protein N' (replication factor Y)